jgi:hypothetical protein
LKINGENGGGTMILKISKDHGILLDKAVGYLIACDQEALIKETYLAENFETLPEDEKRFLRRFCESEISELEQLRIEINSALDTP